MAPAPRGRPHKRANGEGTVYQRRDGRWVASVTVNGRAVSRYAATSAEANRLLRGLLAQRERGDPLTADRQLLGDYLENWLDDVRPRLSAQTQQRYESVIRLHIRPAMGRLALSQVSAARIQALYRTMQAAGKGRSLIGTVQTVLNQALGRAEKWGQIARNPAALVDLPRGEHKPGAALTLEQARAFLTTAQSDPFWAYWLTAITTGARPGELAALRWANVDLDGGTALIAATRIRDGGLQIQEYTKTRRQRVLPLLPQTVTALRQHRAAQLAQRLAAGSDWLDLGLVFCSDRGHILEARTMDTRLRRLLAAAGLPRVRPHDLRHSTASLLIALGVDPVTASLMLGHSRPSMTLDLYSHSTSDAMRRAAQTLGAALDQAEN